MYEGYHLLSKTSDVAQPASGATVTLFNSTANSGAIGRGARFKTLVVNVQSSHDSAANGLVIEESDDDGVTWTAIYTKSYVAATDLRFKVRTGAISAPELRVRFTNSANALTTWRFSVLGDPYFTLAS
jgi:hypothetical protein